MSTIRVVASSWGDAQIADVQAVIDSVAQTFSRHAEISAPDPIIVLQSTEPFPRALSEPARTGERIITLATTDRRWSQLAYQFSHEYCHVFTKHYRTPLKHPFKWFEESLCELASLWSLSLMSENWESAPPYPHWSPYASSLRKYALERLEGVVKHSSPEDFREWLIPNLEVMALNSTNRDLNQVVAVRLYPSFLSEPKLWQAVESLNQNPNLNGDFQSYLYRWHETVSDHLRDSVASIADLLGFPLNQQTEQD